MVSYGEPSRMFDRRVIGEWGPERAPLQGGVFQLQRRLSVDDDFVRQRRPRGMQGPRGQHGPIEESRVANISASSAARKEPPVRARTCAKVETLQMSGLASVRYARHR